VHGRREPDLADDGLDASEGAGTEQTVQHRETLASLRLLIVEQIFRAGGVHIISYVRARDRRSVARFGG
jgi:hypothetical protein